jgi:hypothetical protein
VHDAGEQTDAAGEASASDGASPLICAFCGPWNDTRRMAAMNVGILSMVLASLCSSDTALPARGGDSADRAIAAYVADARATAQSRYRVRLVLDTRDLDALAAILSSLQERHKRSPLSRAALVQETKRWGALLGEILRSIYDTAYWGGCKQYDHAYSYSLYVPLESGGWLEANVFDFAERLITGKNSKFTIRQELTLYLLD